MFPCNQLPSDATEPLLQEDFDALYKIQKTLPSHWLGVTVQHAIVDETRFEFVKMEKMHLRLADAEMTMACALNALRAKTPCFAYCMGWNIIGWNFASTYEWSSKSFDGTSLPVVIFLIIHAFAWATKHLGSFRFTDFYKEYIRGDLLMQGEVLNLEMPGLPNVHFRLAAQDISLFVPRLLKINASEPPGNSLVDFKTFMFTHCIDHEYDEKEIAFFNGPEYTEASRALPSDYGVLVRLLTENRYFDDVVQKVHSTKRVHFHACGDNNIGLTNGPLDDSLMQEFLREFRLVKQLGQGSFGLVMEAHDFFGHSFAVKFVNYEPGLVENEINISCRLPHNRTPVFTRMHGWLHIETPPPLIEQTLQRMKQRRFKHGHGWVAMISDLNAVEMIEDPLNGIGNAQCFFMLLHGLAWARLEFGHFRHRDIKQNNIMLIYRDNPLEPLYFPVPGSPDDEYWEMEGPIYAIPKFIDAGLARVTPQGLPEYDGVDNLTNDDITVMFGAAKKNDLYRLDAAVFMRRPNLPDYEVFIDSAAYARATAADRGDYETLVQLLDHPYFEGIVKRRHVERKRRHIGSTCSICFSSTISHQLNVDPSYTYCGDACMQKHEMIKKFIPPQASARPKLGGESRK